MYKPILKLLKGDAKDVSQEMLAIVKACESYLRIAGDFGNLKGMELILRAPDNVWNVRDLLGPAWRPVAHSVIALHDVTEKVAEIEKQASLESLCDNLNLYETVMEAKNSDEIKDPALNYLMEPSEKLLRVFEKTAEGCLDTVQTIFTTVEKFVGKFCGVRGAAEKWEIDSVSELLTNQDTKHDFKMYQDDLGNLQAALVSLDKFTQHKCAGLESLQRAGNDLKIKGEKLEKESQDLASLTMVVSCIAFPEDGVQLETVIKHVEKTFKFKKDALPEIVQKKVASFSKAASKEESKAIKFTCSCEFFPKRPFYYTVRLTEYKLDSQRLKGFTDCFIQGLCHCHHPLKSLCRYVNFVSEVTTALMFSCTETIIKHDLVILFQV